MTNKLQDALIPHIPEVLYFVYLSIFQNTIFTLIIKGILVHINLSQPLRVRVLYKSKIKRKREGEAERGEGRKETQGRKKEGRREMKGKKNRARMDG